ncbi:hypothetical protein GQ37_006160 [Janthinobacterium sp. BJB1]|uniref:hypothetical protein n=1 Tax=Janthinobacterium sp. GW458P TaxID=1981504 RepID=UPI000A31FE71|nr:hypothetical protein [Janthinobacterium sp. GW458P]MBE3024701.1 hypothetical protein [Janthinobacterium sp. GW458P]PJC99880.1 hypothetical protein GQ37_006160 [Janthinobacterium sp. BJB1]
MTLRPALLALLFCAIAGAAHAQKQAACPYAAWKSGFKGDARAQATCLLRPVKLYARLDDSAPLPEFLDAHIGRRTGIPPARLRAWLAGQDIAESELGGPVDAPLSRAMGRLAAPMARYFVIHDTSYPNFLLESIPGHINDASWDFNDFTLRNPALGGGPKGHVYVNRLGDSLAVRDFGTAGYASKLEKEKPSLTGLFLHVELVQPRHSVPGGGKGNDGLAPDPGFTPAQYERLALLYMAASVRKGTWLIPAFHAVLDTGYANGHDDPQNFSLADWSQALDRLHAALEAGQAQRQQQR